MHKRKPCFVFQHTKQGFLLVVDEETQIWDRKGWGKPEDGAQEEMVRIASVEEKKE